MPINFGISQSISNGFVDGTFYQRNRRKAEYVLFRLEARWSRPASIALDGNKRHVLWKTPYGNIWTLIQANTSQSCEADFFRKKIYINRHTHVIYVAYFFVASNTST